MCRFLLILALIFIPAYAESACDINCGGTCNQHGPGTCDIFCNEGYAVDFTTHTCKPCDPHCIGGCLGGGVGKCDNQCEAGYGLESRTCVPCHPQCAVSCTLYGRGNCDGECKERYGKTMVNRTMNCLPCDVNCLSACNKNGGGTCDSRCRTGYELNRLKLCEDVDECRLKRHNCSVNATCTNTVGSYVCSCKPGLLGDGYTCGSCNTNCSCSPGFVWHSDSCSACDRNCVLSSGCARSGDRKCDSQCRTGFVLDAFNKCQACSAHCKSGCQNEGIGYCDSSCDDGFVLEPVPGTKKHVCSPCAQYCTSGCQSEGAGWCDANGSGVGQCVRGRWTTVGSKHSCN